MRSRFLNDFEMIININVYVHITLIIPCELPVFQTRFWSPPASACLCSGYGVADEKLCTCCSVYLLFRRVPEGVRGLARCRIEVNYDV